MPKIKIDGKEYIAKENETILQCAQRNGIYIPRYCYHPSLSIAGNCRMCLVEIEKMPKLQTACSTIVAEGMNVFTSSEKVKKARKDVLEFLLKNHPIDCPICDQAGECYLQDYYMDYGLRKSRVSLNEKVRRGKRRQLGDYLILDNERCILCTRCVRFCEEVTKTSELFVANRGDHSFIDIKPETSLNNPYSLNIADICPVGAFTSADFRFRQRVWFLKTTESICLGCATGCRIKVQHNDNTVYRILPLPNEETNTWLCDFGRMTYKEMYSEDRLNHITIESQEFGLDLDKVFDYIKEVKPQEIAVFLSPNLSIEDNIALYYFASNVLKTENIFIPSLPERKIEDGILKNSDPYPNSTGIEIIANKLKLKKDEKTSEKFALVISSLEIAKTYARDSKGIFFSLTKSDMSGAIVPMKSYFENEGTFVNWQKYARKTTVSVVNEKAFSVFDVMKRLAVLFGSNSFFSSLKDIEKFISSNGIDKEFK